MRWKRAMAALAAAGIFAGLGTGTAAAQQPHTTKTYHYYTNTYGIPTSVKAGTSFYADAWYMQDSPVRLDTTEYDLAIWSGSASTDRGFTVSWFNPITHRWQASNGEQSWTGGKALIVGYTQGFTMLPHHWYEIRFKVTVGKNVHPGTWHLGASVGMLIGLNGTYAPPMQWSGTPLRLLNVHH
jgi:hypothetical protein